MADDQPKFLQLRELLEHPSLLLPPPVVLPRLAWAGRLTMLAAPEKAGKSTLLGQAAATLTSGGVFLGERLQPGNVLWLALDEPLDDLVRRLAGHGAVDGIVICCERPSLAELESAIHDFMIRLLVIDTLVDYAAGFVETPSQPTEWQALLKPLSRVLRETNTAAVVLHHTAKAGGKYADSRQIGASVDVILEMTEDETDTTVRKFRARGRVAVKDFRLRFSQGRYEPEEAELPLEMRVYRVIEASPGIGATKLRKAVVGRSEDVDQVVATLLRQGTVEDRGQNGTRAFHVVLLENPGQGWDRARDRGGDSRVNALGQRWSDSGQASGQPHHVRPPIRGEPGQGGWDGVDNPEEETIGDLSEETRERLAIQAEGAA